MEKTKEIKQNKFIVDARRNEYYEDNISSYDMCMICGISWEYLVNCAHPSEERIINAKVILIPNEHVLKVASHVPTFYPEHKKKYLKDLEIWEKDYENEIWKFSKQNKGKIYLCIGCLKTINKKKLNSICEFI